MGPNVISHWTSEAKKLMSPAIAAALTALILTAKFIICKENPTKIPVWEKIRQSIPQLV
jgi:hypothetical protein